MHLIQLKWGEQVVIAPKSFLLQNSICLIHLFCTNITYSKISVWRNRKVSSNLISVTSAVDSAADSAHKYLWYIWYMIDQAAICRRNAKECLHLRQFTLCDTVSSLAYNIHHLNRIKHKPSQITEQKYENNWAKLRKSIYSQITRATIKAGSHLHTNSDKGLI